MLSVALFAAVVAFIIFWRRSNDWMALFTALMLVVAGVSSSPADGLLGRAYPVLGPLLVGRNLIVDNLLIFLLVGLFPTGQFMPRWIGWLTIPLILWEIFYTFDGALNPNRPPFLAQYPGFLVILAFWGIGLLGQIHRYRRFSTPTQRQQTKWILLAATVALVTHLIYTTLFSLPGSDTGTLLMKFFVPMLLLDIPIMILLVAFAFSILRYRLYDVDLVINRSLVYGAVTLALLIFFIGSSLLLRQVIGQSEIALIIPLVGAALLFNPARKAAQHVIDRRFYGFRFDLNQLQDAQQTSEIKNPGALTGCTLGSYQVLGVLGKGGMGEVYQGRDSQGHLVAIKILPHDLAQQADFRKRFEREAQTLAALSHPNIVRIYDAGENEGILYIAMEFIEGRELGNLIHERGAIPLDEAYPFMADFAAGLDYAHQHNLVHRDIKPSNIMIRRNADGETPQAVLMDFGIAKVQDAQTALTGTGAIGTIDYMAPEQILAAKGVDHRADIYALGVVLYEMLTGQRPFKGSVGQILFAHLQQPSPDPRDVCSDLPASTAHAILKAMAKNPDERFQSAREFAESLKV
jgi:serine/threonine-protein kinase